MSDYLIPAEYRGKNIPGTDILVPSWAEMMEVDTLPFKPSDIPPTVLYFFGAKGPRNSVVDMAPTEFDKLVQEHFEVVEQ
ncbi:MAG: hypothetical protein KJ601_03875 [Nanoarchaeota archaeon]|nr:hypothetical protein [Nanoarchaeota archaeon]